MSIRTDNFMRRSLTRACFVLLLAAIVVVGARVNGASGLAATQLGQAGKAPEPACPDDCFVFAKVTGFQTTANGKRALFKIPQDGHLVGWRVKLSKPAEDDIASLTSDFGDSSASISVLKQKDGNSFKLTKESPTVNLTSALGRSPIYTLDKALKVKAGTVVALSSNSWVSDFAQLGDLTDQGDKWRASRKADECGDDPAKSPEENEADLLQSKPHRKVGSIRSYGCTYGMGRILYWAYFVPSGGGK